ncbi:hypothetical protein HMSSN036_41400 [Paenibacillus macerans]|nr:hypothetical protein HMSSN036_41400 [Paenibacillus macerans]
MFELLTMKLPIVYIGEKLFDQAGMNVYARYKQYHREILDYFTNATIGELPCLRWKLPRSSR